MNIRYGTKADAPRIVEFQAAMAMETENKTLDTEVVLGAVNDVFDDANKGFYVVAEEDGIVIGGLMVTFEWSDWRRGWWWWIQSVYIVSEARGKKIYSQLYDFVKDKAREASDVKGIRLYVETENVHAQRVYEKLGMERLPYYMYDHWL
ncbi:MAG TPA: GNAT family N-acetyltransferase [Pyrinomonadaceae bacterium]|nr:GNAT family N-acetyltransferase [Pyrinomonadaceae bacterium]